MTDNEYKEIYKATQKWFDENIDKEYLKELMGQPVSPKMKEYMEKSSKFSFGAYIEIPKEIK